MSTKLTIATLKWIRTVSLYPCQPFAKPGQLSAERDTRTHNFSHGRKKKGSIRLSKPFRVLSEKFTSIPPQKEHEEIGMGRLSVSSKKRNISNLKTYFTLQGTRKRKRNLAPS